MWVEAAMALGSLASSYGEQKKQKAFLEEERRRQQQASDEAAERIDAATQKAGQPIRRAMAGQRVALSARDPFMEMAVQQGAYQQTAAETRKAALASGRIGAGGRVRGQAAARAGAAAQGLLSRESMRIQRQRELNQLIGQEAAQLGEITMAGMRTREQTVQGYQDRISQLRQQQAAMPDFGAQALRGAVGAMASGGAFEGMTGGDAFSGINDWITGGMGLGGLFSGDGGSSRAISSSKFNNMESGQWDWNF